MTLLVRFGAPGPKSRLTASSMGIGRHGRHRPLLDYWDQGADHNWHEGPARQVRVRYGVRTSTGSACSQSLVALDA
jgi:hypothetical protein